MKRAIVLTLVALFALGAGAYAATATQILYPGQNLIAPALVPFDPAPTSVFVDSTSNAIPIDFQLTRWDAVGQGYVLYNPFDGSYGNVLLGDGAWLPVESQVTWQYSGVEDGVPSVPGDSTTQTDMWISLPKAGLTLIGHPFAHSVTFANCLITDGTQTVSIDQARTNGWTDGMLSGWDAVGQGYITVGIDPWYAQTMDPYQGYWVSTTKDNLALIVPANG